VHIVGFFEACFAHKVHNFFSLYNAIIRLSAAK